jgi:hypothetical protein
MPCKLDSSEEVGQDSIMQKRQLWYTRRKNKVRGPFPSGQITGFILLGRVLQTDEISLDQINWRLVSEMPELIPEEMKADLSDPAAQERLLLAKYREDERNAGDRRVKTRVVEGKPKKDRRKQEPVAVIQHRAVRTEVLKDVSAGHEHYSMRLAIAFVAVAFLVSVAFQYSPTATKKEFQCGALPGPGVDWSNCQMEGAQLSGTDLTNAQLRNSNFTGANMANSKIAGADLAYGNFSLANLQHSDLSHAKMKGMVLRNADMTQANLFDAQLSYAVLQGADLSEANLKNADLSHADLSGANINQVKLQGTKLGNAVWVDKQICAPESIDRCERIKE